MKSLKEVLIWLEQTRKGYKYTVTISWSQNHNKWNASVHGECYEDKSKPFDFVTVSVEDFDKLPLAVYAKSKELIDDEIARTKNNLLLLNKSIEALQQKSKELIDLQSKLNYEHPSTNQKITSYSQSN